MPLYIWMPVCFCMFSNSFTFCTSSDESLYYSTEGNKRVNFSRQTAVFYISGFSFHFRIHICRGLVLLGSAFTLCVCAQLQVGKVHEESNTQQLSDQITGTESDALH